MKVSGTATLNAPPEQVWAALNDPAVLVRTIPGCQELQTLGPDQYRMTVTAGVASIKGTYLGDVTLADHEPYSAFTLRANGSGAPGTVNADVRVALDGRPDGTTLLRYDADAVVGGTVGGVGQRVLGGVARKLAGEFFSAVDRHLTSDESGADETSGTGEVSDAASGSSGAVPEQAAAPAAEAVPWGADDTSDAGSGPGPVPGTGSPAGAVGSAASPGRAVAPAASAASPAAGSAARAGAGAPGQVFTRPASPPSGGVPGAGWTDRSSLLPAVVGAGIALLGVVIGWRIGRRP